ncbi:uncharacterized protein K452DRAFT_298450 [Aplosporella prunicola CBS 121167]|uniref:Uncharacterized protein n=1 Tax=Aplosporella prunicola CBS 121167 TaxID=1176127 RepID=A0A6A6BEP5_9PEZI|nr:uncharacterized protein K452DRAFT_298450 [Aplosporella prunicola CBS 121167]KAF2141785.1 hypothetical protein K452DRAFT_298450 [Aplosporella prunicola CBS 121167]
MAASQDRDSDFSAGDGADLAQAFKDLARGERTASAMEDHLTALERKIDEMLAQANANAESADQKAPEEASSERKEGTAEGNGGKDSSSA